ncbi:LysR family transcriptional regulator [Pseudomonas monteilii]|jgi:DNA-binding transcriptional LysR family regulator|uniref:LysR family transcriptional regulator n=1 Tax=Pseudomonas putida TaxID=303 RepID=A0A7U6M5K0_PSEPU|nr:MULTISPECIES: LysR family transcriptional regulator [Pseudomonas]MBB3271497.1 DNA-binding transcriptional LysR family regulator [Pseudomonas sp. OG7]MBH3397411.1 LysR family transcriptional regulator [Pseudomonas monteilii]MBH3457892.1 LysR family transcriptional regulator [Pseudomonas monteilii]MDD2125583.1 LysR family transcriptional regulator [Pseudomonas monteilii]MDI3372723.1 LysR family transcriptional regulator [Pseudomonas sp. V104_10]
MDQIHLMKVFVAVGELESFAAAARRLDISPAAVTRAVCALEDQLGVKLLQRTTRSVRLTEAGGRYLEDTRHILASINEANAAAAGINATPKGDLAVTAPILFGKKFVMPCIVRYLQQYPEVDVSAYFLDRVVNMVEEGMDVAVRIGPLPDSGLKALRVGRVRRMLCASPDYLARHGVPKHPSELAGHAVIGTTNLSPRAGWRFGVTEEPTMVRMKPRLTVTSNDGAIAAASGGLGIARLLSYQVADELANGQLQVILAEYEEAPWPIHVLHRESKYGSAKVRAFIDMLAQTLRAQQLD